jgi:predicted metal-dependent hydrolase
MATMSHVRVTSPRFDFGGLKAHLVASDLFLSNWLNAYTIIVGDVERYIRRTVEAFVPRLTSSLQSDVRKLVAQEMNHAWQHDRASERLAELGVACPRLKRFYQLINYGLLEPLFSPKFNLAIASGVEHFNLASSVWMLRSPDMIAEKDTEVGKFLFWHFGEEIEHRSVVHDVYAEIGSASVVRAGGAMIGYLLALTDLLSFTVYLAAKGGALFDRRFWHGIRAFLGRKGLLRHLARNLRALSSSTYHPSTYSAIVDSEA